MRRLCLWLSSVHVWTTGKIKYGMFQMHNNIHHLLELTEGKVIVDICYNIFMLTHYWYNNKEKLNIKSFDIYVNMFMYILYIFEFVSLKCYFMYFLSRKYNEESYIKKIVARCFWIHHIENYISEYSNVKQFLIPPLHSQFMRFLGLVMVECIQIR